MEKAVGIVSEFNPFHFGHEHLFSQVKKAFPEKDIICVMSGNFVQRGSLAVQEKYSRALCAVKGGADLVLELVPPFSCLSAESFASSAVSVLNRIAVCDTIAFGTECDDADLLANCARRLSSPEFEKALRDALAANPGAGYPAARERVYEALYGPCNALSLPNASLAISYLSACQKQKASLAPYPILRKGEGFHSMEQEGEFLSATALRACIREGKSLVGKVPESGLIAIAAEAEAGRFPVSQESLAPVLFYLLKMKTRKELSQIYGFSALCDRARRFADSCSSIEELVEKMKNPSFTDSRIRRGLLALLLDVPRYVEKEQPSYTTVLAANETGRKLLSQMKEVATLPVFTKPAHALQHEDLTVQRQASRAYLADEIYAMAFPKKQQEGYFVKKMPYIISLDP